MLMAEVKSLLELRIEGIRQLAAEIEEKLVIAKDEVILFRAALRAQLTRLHEYEEALTTLNEYGGLSKLAK